MSVISNNQLAGAAGQGGSGYKIEKSLRFNSEDSSYLNTTFSQASTTYTFSCWLKLGALNSYEYIFTSGGSGLAFDGSSFYVYDGSSVQTTTAKFRDPAAWYHLVFSVNSGSFTLYVNGVSQKTGTASALSTTSNDSFIGKFTGTQYYLNGYLAEVHFIDGQALAATDFGEYDDNNVWQSKEFTGSYTSTNTSTTLTQVGWDPSTTNAGNHTLIWDGSTTNKAYGYAGNSIGTVTFSPPLTGVTKVECYTQDYNHYLNGSSISTTEDVNGGWHTYYDNSSSPITLTSVGNAYSNNTQTVDLAAIRINGTIIDSSTWTPPSGVGVQSSGVNSFYLKFADNSSNAALGTDSSGQSNTWTVNNLSVASGSGNDSVIDSPTNYTANSGNNGGNYCTWNPLNKNSNSTLSNGNLLASSSAVHTVLGTIAFPDSGKYYAEFTVTAINSGYPVIGILANNDSGITASQNPNTGVSYFQGGSVSLNGSSTGTTLTAMSAGDIVGVAYDAATRKVWFSLNGTFLNSGNPAAGTNEITTLTENSSGYSWACCPYSTATVTLNAGQRSFSYTPPTGYKSLCTTNLPDPTIADPSTVFDVALWTANGSSQAIGGLNFSPDLVWAKSRNTATTPHLLVDSVRGVNKVLSTHTTAAEEDYSGISGVISAFNSDGFDTGGNSDIATNNRTFVAWCWDAGSSNTSVSAGGLNSSAYDQSEDWSGGSVSGAVHSSVTWEDAFDGALGTGVFTYATNTSTLTMPSGTTWSNKFEVYALKHGGTLYVNGTDVGASMSGFTSTAQWHDITSIVGSSGTLSSIGVSDVSTNYVKLFAVRLDGKILVDSGESPTNVPSIASTYRANPSSGFSIVKFTNGNGTVAHGLNSPPELIITKDIANTYTWSTYSKPLTKDAYMAFNSSNASSTVAGMWGSEEPTSLQFGTSTYVAASGNELIAYCFAPVDGFSAFGRFYGNSSTDGVFQYCGFTPRWIMFKRDDGSVAADWRIIDTARSTSNVADEELNANLSDAESTVTIADILSNGFKMRTSANGINGGNYITWVAFAEHPFKTAHAR